MEPDDERWHLVEDPGPHQSARRDLAEMVRSLIDACVLTEVSAEELQEVSTLIGGAVERLRAKRGYPFFEAVQNGHYQENRAVYADRNMVIGRGNPIAPPMRVRSEGERVVAEVSLGRRFEGAPGLAHGGIIASMFDQLFGSLLVRLGVPALTGKLNVRYRRPTPLESPLVMEGGVKKVVGRRYLCEATLRCEDEIVAESDVMMVAVENDQIRALFAGAHEKSGA